MPLPSGTFIEILAKRLSKMPRDTWNSFWNAHSAIKPMAVVFVFAGFLIGTLFSDLVIEPQANNACAALTREGGE
ncbi:hypothetical protein AD945_06275 [Gluconobacter albidus]|uniref:Uncharacterized protein n=1 Tax=Gluconobacter albidus TaxID=318683 RepID=A0A149TK37_9PROT|nr:hypothetical protein AD945_06275 [Gluconobacter albidus]